MSEKQLIAKNIIYTGDTTTHGGTLLDGCDNHTRNGSHYSIQVGHKFWCPQCLCWSKFIEGTPRYSVHGRNQVLEGHRTSCGAAAIHRLGFNDTCEDDAGSGRNGEISKRQEAARAAKSNQGGTYSHNFSIHNPTDNPIGFIVFKGDVLLDIGMAGKDSFGGGRSAKVYTQQGEKVHFAMQAPRPKLK